MPNATVLIIAIIFVLQHAAKGSRCLFTERHAANDYTEFRSVANPRWYLGFNRGGRRLAGDQWTKARDKKAALKCYQFIKTDFNPNWHKRGRLGADSAGAKGGPPPLPDGSAASSSLERNLYSAVNRRDGVGKHRRSSEERKATTPAERKNKPPK